MKAIKLLDLAWNSVTDISIQNCFRKVRFALSTSEESMETASEPDNSADGIWERWQAVRLVLESFNFNEYVESDADLITREAITISTVVDDLRVSKHSPGDQENDDDEDNSLD